MMGYFKFEVALFLNGHFNNLIKEILYCLCSFVCCVLFECGVLFCVMCVICVLCLIVVSLPPDKTPFAVKYINTKIK
jgi:hypothetical protein